jgi:hypothetical protein
LQSIAIAAVECETAGMVGGHLNGGWLVVIDDNCIEDDFRANQKTGG